MEKKSMYLVMFMTIIFLTIVFYHYLYNYLNTKQIKYLKHLIFYISKNYNFNYIFEY